MKIVSIVINIETSSEKDSNFSPKSIIMNGNEWKLPDCIFPRDIRLISTLEELVREYNRQAK